MVGYKNGEKREPGSIYLNNTALAVAEFMDANILEEVFSTCMQALEKQTPKTSKQKLIIISLQDLLRSKTGIKTLKQYGCFDAADKVLQKMEQLIKTQEV